jgi:hypothetical protein
MRPRSLAIVLLALAARAAPASGEGPDVPGRPSPAARAAYWVERILTGPEPTVYAIRDLHDTMLTDALRNLRALPDEALERLADPAVQARVFRSASPEDPWLAVLDLLASIGARRPDVARAWAVPALAAREVLVARRAVPVLAALGSPEDAEALARVLDTRGDDRVLGPAAAGALATRGAPWDAVAAAWTLAEAGPDQQDGGSSAWDAVPGSLAARPDRKGASALAWWALLAESRAPAPRSEAVPAVGTGDATAQGAYPRVLPLLVGDGRGSAARARAELARAGFEGPLAAVRADAAGTDPQLAGIAREALRAPGPAAVRDPAAAAERLRDLARDLEGGRARRRPDEALAVVVGAPDGPDSARDLETVFASAPLDVAWSSVVLAAYDALARSSSVPRATVRRWLASGDPRLLDRALVVVGHALDAEYVPALEAWFEGATAGPRAREGRQLAVRIVTTALRERGLEPEEPARWARKLAEWASDPKDPSAAGWLGALVELGPAGEAVLAEALAGPRREAALELVQRSSRRYLSPDVVAAVLAPVDTSTPTSARRRALDAAFAVADVDAVPALRALARRLRPEDREEVAVVTRVVLHRARAKDLP